MKLSTNQLILSGYAVALLVLGLVALFAYSSTRQYVTSVTQRRGMSDRIEALARFHSLLKDAETGQRGYLLNKQPASWQVYTNAEATWQQSYDQLVRTYNHPTADQRKALEELLRLTRATMAELRTTVELRKAGTAESDAAWRALVDRQSGVKLMTDIRKLVDKIEAEDRQAFEALNEQTHRVANTTIAAVTFLCPLALSLMLAAVVLTRRDLQRRALAEAELAQQRVQLSAIVNSMREAVVVADEHGKLIHFNPAAERLLGRGPSQHDAGHWTQEYGVFAADGVTPMPVEQLPIVRALRGESLEFSEMHIRPPGSTTARVVAGTASPLIDENGRRCGGIVILRDVTASRTAERRFQSLLESAPDGLVIVNQQGIIELVNSQVLRLFGYTEDQLVGQAVEILVPDAQRAAHPGQRDAFFANPRIRNMGSGLELSALRADGSLIPVEISLSPVEGGEQMLVCAAIRDVTERRRAMDQIRELNEELEIRVLARTSDLASANQELAYRNQENEMFVYSVSHDLRSPLVNLQGFSQELEGACVRLTQLADSPGVDGQLRQAIHEIIDTDVKESIHFIRTSVSRLSGIIDALLRLSRAGRVVYQWQAVNVQQIVAKIVDAANVTINQRQAEVIVHPLPAAAGDATSIDQVFANLIQNALHYLDPSRPGRLEIGSLPIEPGAALTTYFVQDNGVGIPREQQAKVFQAFQRLSPHLAGGEGMGLTLVQRIVERHGGRIWLESIAGKGTTFYFTLPHAAASDPTAREFAPLATGVS